MGVEGGRGVGGDGWLGGLMRWIGGGGWLGSLMRWIGGGGGKRTSWKWWCDSIVEVVV